MAAQDAGRGLPDNGADTILGLSLTCGVVTRNIHFTGFRHDHFRRQNAPIIYVHHHNAEQPLLVSSFHRFVMRESSFREKQVHF